MNTHPTIFAQILDFLPLYEFRKCVNRYRGEYKIKSFSCLDQFLCMAFAQLTFRESLRDIESCLRSMRNRLYHMGIRGNVSRNTLAHANETRDWRIYADFAQVLIHQARTLYADDDFGLELKDTVYAFDSTTIDLCLSLFPWAVFRKRKGAVKLHTLLDLRGSIPSFIKITDGKVHDVRVLDDLIPEPGCFYVLDRGYLDFARLYLIHQSQAFFVIRAKSNLQYRRLYSQSVDRATDLICDQTVVLTGFYSNDAFPDKLRRVRFYDRDNGRYLTFLSNNFILPPLTIAMLYKLRWRIELFFRWIKQNLRIKAFYGTSENAVKTQIWIAITVYVLVAIVKKR
ncbi:MAG: IS4 family transposase, partial [Candidatus Aminicenantales bacterium]